MSDEIIGLWTLPGSEIVGAMKKSGMKLPDWWKDADKISVRTDEHGVTFIGRSKGSQKKQPL